MVATDIAYIEARHHNFGGHGWVAVPLEDQRRRARRIAIKHEIAVGVCSCERRKTICAACFAVSFVQQFRSANSKCDPIALAFGGNLRPLARIQRQSGRISANLILLIDQNNARRRDPPRAKRMYGMLAQNRDNPQNAKALEGDFRSCDAASFDSSCSRGRCCH
jgi:hypothetical protein